MKIATVIWERCDLRTKPVCFDLSFSFWILFVDICQDHRLFAILEFTINDILTNFYQIFTRSLSNHVQNWKFFLRHEIILRTFWTKKVRSILCISIYHFGFAFSFYFSSIMLLRFQVFSRLYLSKFLLHIHKVITNL